MSEDHKVSENSTQPLDKSEADHLSGMKHEDPSHEPQEKTVQKGGDDDEHEKEQDHQVRKSDDDDDCKTPCLEENKIPGAQSCPPAPSRKRKEEQVGLSHKRKLFFENTVGGAEEIESLFENSSSTVTVSQVSRVMSTKTKRRRKRR